MSPSKKYKLVVTSELVTITFIDGVTPASSYPVDSVQLVASPFNSETYTIGTDGRDSTTLSWNKVTNRYPTSRDNLIAIIGTAITAAKAVGAFSSLTVSGAVTTASLTTSGVLAANSATVTGTVAAGAVTATGALTGASVVTDTIAEQTGGAGVTVDGVLLKDSEITTDVINEKTAAAGVTADGVLCKDSAVAATSGATLGTLTVSSAGALGGTYTLGTQVWVNWDWFLSNASASYQLMGTDFAGFGIVYRVHKWPFTVTWVGYTVGGTAASSATYQSKVSRNLTEISIQSVVNTTASIPDYVALDTPFTTTDGDNIRFSTRQTTGTTGSELTVTLFGYYEI